MTLSADFLKLFRPSYVQSPRVQECYRLKHVEHQTIGGRWTGAMEQVLDKIADTMGVDRQEKRPSPDYLWFKHDRLLAAIEHENDFKEAILYSEVPSLLRTEADLRVLITYPSKTVLPANEMASKLEEQLKRRLTPEKNGSFLFLVAPKEWAKDPSVEPWMYHLWEFHLSQVAGEI